MQHLVIEKVYGREILDSRGNPTVEAEVHLSDGTVGWAAVPSGASTGIYEAAELRDKDNRYLGRGVRQAVSHINHELQHAILHLSPFCQANIDRLLIEADGTSNKEHLGANAILAVSLAVSKAAANHLRIPYHIYIGGISGTTMPVPMMNILNGGQHAKNNIDFQEFMIIPVNASSFSEALRMGTEVYHSLKEILSLREKDTSVGDEGGFAPNLMNTFVVFDYLNLAVEQAGYQPGVDIVYAMDAAASELYQEDAGMYYFPGETNALEESFEHADPAKRPDTISTAVFRSTDEMIQLYLELTEQYPLVSIEDGLHQNDWEGWQKLTKQLGHKVQLVGDDLFVTNAKRLQEGISKNCGNAILIKPNQIGTVTETIDTIKTAKQHGYRTIMSHRSGETEDTTIAELAVALNTGQIKTGAPCRSERVAKYNQLLRIEEELSSGACYPGNLFHSFDS